MAREPAPSWYGNPVARRALDAARSKDYPIVMAVVVIASMILLASYIVRDVAYGIVDPRVRR